MHCSRSLAINCCCTTSARRDPLLLLTKTSSDTSAGGGRGWANTMSATTILRDVSQAVGNAFPIFGNMLPGKCEVVHACHYTSPLCPEYVLLAGGDRPPTDLDSRHRRRYSRASAL